MLLHYFEVGLPLKKSNYYDARVWPLNKRNLVWFYLNVAVSILSTWTAENQNKQIVVKKKIDVKCLHKWYFWLFQNVNWPINDQGCRDLSIVVVPLAPHAVFLKNIYISSSSINACLVKMKSGKEKRSSPGQKRGVRGQTWTATVVNRRIQQ